ncbi:MAG: hypothetical protein K0V04_23475 [Deltaproteobacteria bacterium]|nr:hypothetical protein [Deltaproteobacteria bacterium]
MQTPESIATDYWGNRYVSLALTGEISRIAPDGQVDTLAVLPIGAPLEPCTNFIAIMGALTITPWGLYVNVAACEAADRGVWWVSPWTGATALVANLPPDALPNGIAHRFGQLYVSDSSTGRIWRTSAFGGPAEIWVEDPLLDPVPTAIGAPGPNGLQFYGNELYVANSSTGQLIAFPIEWGQTPGVPRVHATLENGCDDFAFDLYGTAYCTTDPFNTVVAVYPDGESEVLLTIADGLDGPTATAFGRLSDRFGLYITNASFPFFPNNLSPSVMRLELDVPGYPFR